MQLYRVRKMPKRVFISVVSLFVLFNSVYSQFDNSFFDANKYDENIDSSAWQFHFDNLNYFRNTEYTSSVDKGSTFPGFHLLPYAQYQFNSKAVIYGGLFLRYDFGNSNVKTLTPYIKFKYRLWGHDLIFGNLEGNVQHNIIEPMVSYESVITNRMEQGIQVKRENKKVEYDFWIDWQRIIYEGSPFNEVFYGGLNLKYNPILNKTTKLSLVGQGTTVHKAGEIDNSPTANTMEYNYALGTEFNHSFDPNHSLYLAGYYANYWDHTNRVYPGFQTGEGALGILRMRMHEIDLVMTYWQSYDFQSPTGDPLYFTFGRRNLVDPYHFRQMVSLRVANELHVAKNLTFLSRLGFNYNIDHNSLDVVMENYLRWHFRTTAKKVHLN